MRSLAPCSLVCWLILVIPGLAGGAEPLAKALGKADEGNPTLWYDVEHLTVEGRGWADTESKYDRLPGRAKELVRDAVWGLSRHSAGYCVRFASDATTIHARWTLTSASLAMPHMAATGVSGLDLYVKSEEGWRWLATGRPTAVTNSVQLVSGIPAGEREYLLYFPLYNGVTSVEIGISPENWLAPGAPRPAERAKPIVFYGTSITQGGCASRTGMVHTAILGRRLDVPVINLGFSGNGRMELELADLMAELDPAVYVLDCLPNIGAAEVTERTEPFVKKLREAHPETPILLVEDRSYSGSYLITSQRERNETSRAALRKAYERLQEAGVKHLYYLEGEHLLSDDRDDTVDGSHPTDLGFVHHADAFEKVLRPLLD